jgi:hypothetical protein
MFPQERREPYAACGEDIARHERSQITVRVTFSVQLPLAKSGAVGALDITTPFQLMLSVSVSGIVSGVILEEETKRDTDSYSWFFFFRHPVGRPGRRTVCSNFRRLTIPPVQDSMRRRSSR